MIVYLASRVESLGQLFLPVNVAFIEGDYHFEHDLFFPGLLVSLSDTKFVLEVGENLLCPVNLQIFGDEVCHDQNFLLNTNEEVRSWNEENS